MPDTRSLHVCERHSPSGMFRAHRTAQKAVAVQDPHCSEVTRLIADGHRLANRGRQSGIDLPQPLKVHTVSAHHAGLRNPDQQQGQLCQTLRHTRQPPRPRQALMGARPGARWGRVVYIPRK